MPLEFRLALESDLAALKRLDAECFPSGSLDLQPAAPGELEAGIREANTLLAESEGEVIGMMQVHQSETGLELLTLAITQSFRGHGLGRAFLDELENRWLKPNQSVWCVTSPNNLAMQSLLESYGFVSQKLLPDHFGKGAHRLLYRRD
jgi:ribosomal protein S18 acetylase RimI-like enzyme